MVDYLNETFMVHVMNDDGRAGREGPSSFKNIRKTRKKHRLRRHLEKSLSLKKINSRKSLEEKPAPGPTKETIAKLTQDPLIRFKNNNILNDEQIWAFRRIRRAVQVITDGTQVRTSRFNDVVVQTGRYGSQTESEYEVRIKDYYSRWIDRMTSARRQVGPVLDIIIDEMSLTAVDRKWGRRKGWAKSQIQASLDMYEACFSSDDRGK